MAPSHPNLTLVHQFFHAYATHNQEAIKQILAADIKWVIPGNHPLSGVKNGVNEVLDYLAQLGRAAFQAEPIVFGVNETFVIDCHHNWSNLAAKANFRGMSCLLWKIEQGKIVEVYNFPQDQHLVDAFFQDLYR